MKDVGPHEISGPKSARPHGRRYPVARRPAMGDGLSSSGEEASGQWVVGGWWLVVPAKDLRS
jgi:hypothetical protein